MSNILSVYTAIAAQDITITPYGTTSAVTPKAYKLHEIPASVEDGMLPCRLLLMDDRYLEAGQLQWATLAGSLTMVWQVVDLLLWEPTGGGLVLYGPRHYDMLNYAGLYADALIALRQPTRKMQLEGARVEPGVYEYPQGSGRLYYGALAVLNYKEILP